MIKPMLCQPADKAFDSPDYIWETKYDGARIIAYVNGAERKLQGRSGAIKTTLFPDLDIRTKVPAILDGEVISGNSFNDLQHRVNRLNGIASAAKAYPAKYVVFDVLEVNGINARGIPLIKRKEYLQTLLIETDTVSLAPFTDKGAELFEEIMASQGEGVIGKRKQGAYLEDKREWLKVKTWQEGTFLVVGYTKGTGWRATTFGALVLSDTKGRYVGSVGTGFTDLVIANIYREWLVPAPCPFPREPEPATWVKPFAAKIQYLEFTNDGMLRFPSFKGVV
jgi:bifunctional non-homologous end joining protein LigD